MYLNSLGDTCFDLDCIIQYWEVKDSFGFNQASAIEIYLTKSAGTLRLRGLG